LVSSLVLRYPGFELYRSQQIARQVILEKPDLFISVWSWLHPDAVKQIRDAGIKAVLVYPDHIANLDRQYALLAPYHRLFFKDPYAVRTFREKAGLEIEYLPEACNPMWHKPVELTEAEQRHYGCEVTTASSMYPYRMRILESLDGYDLKLWGPASPSWLHSTLERHQTGVGVHEGEKAKAFSAARVVVNTMHYAEIEGVNVRTFEIAGCGAFQIADAKPALAELFVPDREIVTFSSREELRDKVGYYLQHKEQRARISAAGHARAYREHTYTHRLERIFKSVGL
jgi:spore maturation protein CgeB